MKTPEQTAALQQSFEQCCYVSAAERQRLMQLTGLKSDQIGKWFEHRRAALRQECAERGIPVPVELLTPPPRPIGGSRRAVRPVAPAATPSAATTKATATTTTTSASGKKRVKEMIQLIKKKSLSDDQFLELSTEWAHLTHDDTIVPTAMPPDATLRRLAETTELDVELVSLWFERRLNRLRRQAARLAEITATATATTQRHRRQSDDEDDEDDDEDDDGDDDDEGEDRAALPTSGSKHLTSKQRRLLEGAFLTDMYPDKTVIRRLASSTGLHPDRIKNWFCARRARARKEAPTAGAGSLMRSCPSYQSLADSEHSSMASSCEFAPVMLFPEDVPRRPDRYTEATLAVLIDAFERPPYGFISTEEKTQLALTLGLTEKQVKTWFTGERSRRRKNGEVIEPPAIVLPPPPPAAPTTSTLALAGVAAAAAAAAAAASTTPAFAMTNVYHHIPATAIAVATYEPEVVVCGKRGACEMEDEVENVEDECVSESEPDSPVAVVDDSVAPPPPPPPPPFKRRRCMGLTLPATLPMAVDALRTPSLFSPFLRHMSAVTTTTVQGALDEAAAAVAETTHMLPPPPPPPPAAAAAVVLPSAFSPALTPSHPSPTLMGFGGGYSNIMDTLMPPLPPSASFFAEEDFSSRLLPLSSYD